MLLGSGLSEVAIIIVLEAILCLYSVGMIANAKSTAIKVVHIVLLVLWAVCAIRNLIVFIL